MIFSDHLLNLIVSEPFVLENTVLQTFETRSDFAILAFTETLPLLFDTNCDEAGNGDAKFFEFGNMDFVACAVILEFFNETHAH